MIDGGVRLQADLPALTIRSLRTVAVHVPMKRALGTSARRMDIAPLVLIDLETEEGITGRAYVFCEVKSRSSTTFGAPVEAVTRTKQARIRRLAVRWLQHEAPARSLEIRFDVASVLDGTIEVVEGAF